MKKAFVLICIATLLLNLTAAAQKNRKKEKTSTEVTAKLTPEYTLAQRLANDAVTALKAGETKAADSLIKKSIATYPVYEIMDYAKELMLLPDVVGSNIIMSLLKERLELMQGNVLIVGFMESMMANGKPPIPKEYDKERAYFTVLSWIYNLNRTYASRPYILKSISDLSLPKIIEDKTRLMGFDYEYNQQANYEFIGATYKGEYEKARALINAMKPSTFITKEMLLGFNVSVDLASGDYQKGLERANEMAKNSMFKGASEVWFFNLYATMGDDKAIDYYNKIDKLIKENNAYYYKLAQLYLANKDYNTALKHIEKSNSLRNEKVIIADMIVEGWDFYKTYGEILTGLKQYDKARDNFNISLIYYPDYKATNDALAKMEVLAGTVINTDKTAMFNYFI